MKASPPSQHGCHQTAAPPSSLVFLREDDKGLESSSCLGVRCETISLTPCHAPAPRENIVCSSGSEPAGECSLKNCCLGKKTPNTDRLTAEITAFHSTGLIRCEIWGKSIPHLHCQLPEACTKCAPVSRMLISAPSPPATGRGPGKSSAQVSVINVPNPCLAAITEESHS